MAVGHRDWSCEVDIKLSHLDEFVLDDLRGVRQDSLGPDQLETSGEDTSAGLRPRYGNRLMHKPGTIIVDNQRCFREVEPRILVEHAVYRLDIHEGNQTLSSRRASSKESEA
ncbi:MAG: hypothetical protein HC888_15190 [Candidatus Competibacteraceae bacterium]|nr:hypothetical protein [Candidatus Competibacteraceae bacterium]